MRVSRYGSTTSGSQFSLKLTTAAEAGSAADLFLQAEGYAASFLDVRLGIFGNYLYERTLTM